MINIGMILLELLSVRRCEGVSLVLWDSVKFWINITCRPVWEMSCRGYGWYKGSCGSNNFLILNCGRCDDNSENVMSVTMVSKRRLWRKWRRRWKRMRRR